jgi:signal peptidase I
VRGLLKFLAWTTGILGVLVLIARFTFLRVWTVPDDPVLNASLSPTIASGDVVLVLYRGKRGLGDLVRCPDPEDGTRWIVGRMFGFEGDQVEVDDRTVTLNGRRLDTTEACSEAVADVPHPVSGHPVKVHCNRVDAGGGWHFRGSVAGVKVSPKSHRVGPGRTYLVSDNISLHDDSRDYGAVPVETCKDKIFFRLWSKKGFGDEEKRFSYIR